MQQANVRESVHPAYARFERMSDYQHPVLLNKLQAGLGLTQEQARALFEDVKRFMALCVSTPQPLAPTKAIDQGWHAFILFTKDYAQFCKDYCGRFVHHAPEDPFAKVRDYESVRRTREIADLVFGNLSPNWLGKGAVTCQGKECSENDCTNCKGAP